MILWISKIISTPHPPQLRKVSKEPLTQRVNKYDCRTDGTTAVKWRAGKKLGVWMARHCLKALEVCFRDFRSSSHPPLPICQAKNQDESQRAEAFLTCKTDLQCSKEYRRISESHVTWRQIMLHFWEHVLLMVFYIKVDVRAPCLCSGVSHFIVTFNPWNLPILLYWINTTICRVTIRHVKSFSN